MTYRRPFNEPDRIPHAFDDGARILRILFVIALMAVLIWAIGSLLVAYVSLAAVLGFVAGVVVCVIAFTALLGWAAQS